MMYDSFMINFSSCDMVKPVLSNSSTTTLKNNQTLLRDRESVGEHRDRAQKKIKVLWGSGCEVGQIEVSVYFKHAKDTQGGNFI